MAYGVMAMWLFLLGLITGMAFYEILSWFRSDGTLIIDDRNEEKTNWELRVDADPLEIPKKKSIRLKVHLEK